jgi:hypothetical protein
MSSHHENTKKRERKEKDVWDDSLIDVEDQNAHKHSDEDPQDRKTIIKYANKTNKILLRKRELFDQLSDKKLEYIKNGICDSYIKYGKPSLNDVINNIKTRTEAKTK